MDRRFAVVDLGTNTFHLLIAEPLPGGGFRELFRQRRYVKLAEDGIAEIGPEPFRRGLEAMQVFQKIITEQQATSVRAFGTAALRTAANGPAFIEQVRALTRIEVDLIDGRREAGLIHKGVSQVVPLSERTDLIMDIGGGSVEFILADRHDVHWSESFPVGVAVLFKEFHRHEPIRDHEIAALEAFLRNTLQPLAEVLSRRPAHRLVGASGTFDVLEQVLGNRQVHPFYSRIATERLEPVYRELVGATLEERLAMPHVPDVRADMITVAMILIDVVVKMTGVRELAVSGYAMKEGMLQEMLQEEAL